MQLRRTHHASRITHHSLQWRVGVGFSLQTSGRTETHSVQPHTHRGAGDGVCDGIMQDALATVIASEKSLVALKSEIVEMSASCPAPTFSCDMSQLLKKASGRLSGNVRVCLTVCRTVLVPAPRAEKEEPLVRDGSFQN